jgi:hypothetical protein
MSLARQSHSKMERHSNIELSSSSIIKEMKTFVINKINQRLLGEFHYVGYNEFK